MKLSSLLALVFFLFAVVQPAHAVFVVKPNATQQETTTTEVNATSEKELSRKEKRELKKEVKKELKSVLKDARKNKDTDMNLLLLIIITILLPPLGVALYEGGITNRFWISLLLTILFYIPGLIYSLIVILE